MINIEEIRKLNTEKYLTDLKFKDDIFKTLVQEVNQRLDDDYINMRSSDPNFNQNEHKVILKFLADLAESVESRRDNDFNRRYEIKEGGENEIY